MARRFVAAVNAGRIDDFMTLFAPRAVVIDGPTYRGAAAIRRWAQRENFGVRMRLSRVRPKNAAGTVVALQARSRGGYSGPGTFTFTIRRGLIARVEIG